MSFFSLPRPSGFHIKPIYDDPHERRVSHLLLLSEGIEDEISAQDRFAENWKLATGQLRCRKRRFSSGKLAWFLFVALSVAALLLM